MGDSAVKSPCWRILAWLPALGMVGCSPLTSKPAPEVMVNSTPAGAEVSVMGVSRGVTPLRLPANAIFPVTYLPEKQSLYGRVRISHPGCETYDAPVNNKDLEDGLHARLKCETSAVPATSETRHARERLKQLEELKQEGLIDEQEYRQARQRIIDTL